MASGVRFRGPVKNVDRSAASRDWFRNLPIGEEPDLCVYFNDFLAAQDYAAADWTITDTGVNTRALAADERYGAVLLTNAAADNDVQVIQGTEENWKLEAGERLWFEARVKVSDADQCDFFIGLNITDTTPLDSSDRVGFQIDDGNASILCKSEKDATETSTDSGVDAADDTYVKLGFYWDGISRVRFYVNRSLVATHTTNNPDDENLCITILLQNGEAVAKTASIDYIYVAAERA